LPQASSPGIYYEAATQYLGFRWGDEGKTMGLAAYGRNLNIEVPSLSDQRFYGSIPTQKTLEDSPRHVHAGVRYSIIEAFRALHGNDLSFNQRADIALASQYVIMQRILDYVTELLDEIDILILSGGVALNCATNAQVAALCDAKGVRLIIPPPASDTGVALGSSLAGVDDPTSVEPLDDAFLGRMYTADMIAHELRKENVIVKEADTQELVLKLLEQSAVCGWFEGRSEIGPRALGKRSIIARPDSTALRDRINVLKGRESWRPLAPSLTQSEFERSFAGSIPSSYMLINAFISGNARNRLASVVHVDDTSRPQVVTSSGAYHTLLKEMGKLNGTEAVICTSFNRAGEPIVYTPVEALQSARAMKLDYLAGDGWYISL
jgi:carbamoyltransferase